MNFQATPEIIEAKSKEFGFYGGWRFLTCAEDRLSTATMAIITCNPGTDSVPDSHPRWSQERGSAYVDEAWPGHLAGEAGLQRQIRGLARLASTPITQVASWHAIPFATKTEAQLEKMQHVVEFGGLLTGWALARCPAKVVCLVGKRIPRAVLARSLDGAKHSHQTIPSGWGEIKIDTWQQNDRKVIALPHLSRFKLVGEFNREKILERILQT